MTIVQLLLAVTLIAGSSSAFASMRCGKQLVFKGDDFDRVSSLCGEADSTRSLGDKYIYRSVGNSTEQAAIAEVIKVDMWIYRGGEHNITRKLYFENGVLVKIELGRR